MATSLQEQLDSLCDLIAQIEAGGGCAEYGQGQERFRYMDLGELYRERRRLQEAVAATSSSPFACLDPCD